MIALPPILRGVGAALPRITHTHTHKPHMHVMHMEWITPSLQYESIYQSTDDRRQLQIHVYDRTKVKVAPRQWMYY